MLLYLLAVNPTDSVTEGFLPAAARLGLDVIVLTDRPDEHRHAYTEHPTPPAAVVGVNVHDFREVVAEIANSGTPDAIFSNSDHLQTPTALAAAFFDLPAKSWRAALRVKNKAQMRRALAAAGADLVFSTELRPGERPDSLARRPIPFPCVLKPREGVASEDVVLASEPAELVARASQIRSRRPAAALVVEEHLAGPLHTLETLGDGERLRVLGGFRTTLSPPPYFVERRMDFDVRPPAALAESVLTQLRVLGVGLGACHTEYVAQGDQARLVEVNYRIIGDRCDLLLAESLGAPIFEDVLRTHLGGRLDPVPTTGPDGPHARIDWVVAPHSGTLTQAPAEFHQAAQGCCLRYRPLRAIGDRRALTNTNRDYIGAVSAHGRDSRLVDVAVEKFLANSTWTVTAENISATD